MGKVILCSGRRAKEPLRIEMTDTVLYTIEELCFYLYQHIYLITEDFFSDYVISWLEAETGQKILAAKLRDLNRTQGSLKDKVICVLCSTDYYTEKEMKDLIVVMDKMDGLPLIKRRKMKADIYVKYERYLFAAREYEAILRSKDASILTPEEYGNLLHNYAVVLMYIVSLKEATVKMKEAYQYLWTLRLMGNTDKIDAEQKALLVPEEIPSNLNEIVKEAESMESGNTYHASYQKLREAKENSDAIKFYRDLDSMLEKWICEYRNKVS